MPEEMSELTLTNEGKGIALVLLLSRAELVKSTSEAMRMVQQGAVRIDGDKVEDQKMEISANTTHVYQVGKRRFARVTLN